MDENKLDINIIVNYMKYTNVFGIEHRNVY